MKNQLRKHWWKRFSSHFKRTKKHHPILLSKLRHLKLIPAQKKKIQAVKKYFNTIIQVINGNRLMNLDLKIIEEKNIDEHPKASLV